MKIINAKNILVITILLAMGGLAFYFVRSRTSIQRDLQTKGKTITDKVNQNNDRDEINEKQLLVPFVPNFENLTLDDLFSKNDIRGVFPYENNLIVIGYSKVIEYDPQKDAILRLSTEELNCTFSGAVFKNDLYIGCNNNEFDAPAHLYRIDLQSGELIEKQNGLSGNNLVNPNFITDGNNLWIGSWNGALKADQSLKGGSLYTPEKIGFSTCHYSNIVYALVDGVITASCNTGEGMASYNAESDSWNFSSGEVLDYEKYFNLRDIDYNLNLPIYFAISDIINNKRYLVSTKGIATLEHNGLPQNILTADLLDYYDPSGIEFPESNTLYITQDESKALLIKRIVYQGPTDETGYVDVLLFELDSQEFRDLIENTPEIDDNELLQQMLTDEWELHELDFEEVNNQILVKSTEQNETLFSIELDEKVVVLNSAQSND